MQNNPLLQLEASGQSIWMDFIRRGMISSGELQQLIEQDGITMSLQIPRPSKRRAPSVILCWRLVDLQGTVYGFGHYRGLCEYYRVAAGLVCAQTCACETVGIISVLAATLSAVQTFLGFAERAAKHREVASRYGTARRRIEELLAISDDKVTPEEIGAVRREIDSIAEEAPNVSDSIWTCTEKKLG